MIATATLPRTSPASEMIWGHDRLQQECYTHLWNQYPATRRTCWHTPNEFHRQKGMTAKEHMIIISQRKAIGVLSGVVDLTWYWKGTLYMFDIKIGRDTLSVAQADFITANVSQGGVFHEISTLYQFQSIVSEIMKGSEA